MKKLHCRCVLIRGKDWSQVVKLLLNILEAGLNFQGTLHEVIRNARKLVIHCGPTWGFEGLCWSQTGWEGWRKSLW